MTTTHDWSGRTGDVWAAEWRRTDRSFADLSPRLDAAILAAAPAGPFRAFDIGCGAGQTSLALAAARADAEVVGVDLSAGLVAVAQARARERATCRFEQADAPVAAAAVRPDLLFSRHGVMFFADPVAAFRALHAAAAPGATLVFSCFAERAASRFATLADELTGAAPGDPLAPGPFAFADPDRVSVILEQAGWRPEPPERVAFAYRVGEGADPIADAIGFLSRVGPFAAALAQSPDRDAVRLELAARLAHYRTGNAVDLPATAWLWRAGKGESA